MATEADTSRSRQRGAVLVVSLLLLLIMTVIGVAAMSTNSLEERIAGNLGDRDLAFQATESGVRACEGYVLNNTLAGQFAANCTNGLCVPAADAATPVWLDSSLAVWTNTARSRQITDPDDPAALPNVAAQPRYIVEDVTSAFGCLPGESCVVGYGQPPVSLYRCTARGVGGTTTAVVINQSVYKKF
jgi:type IV pilus assembly protein PilX